MGSRLGRATCPSPLANPTPAAAFLGLLTEARWFPQIREDTRFYATLILPVLRRTLLEFGRRLVDTGVLDVPEDVFHLKLDELERIDGTWPPPPQLAGELRALVARRKAKRAELKGTPLVDPRLFKQTEVNEDVMLHGTQVAPAWQREPCASSTMHRSSASSDLARC